VDVLAHNQNGLAFWCALGFREYKVLAHNQNGLAFWRALGFREYKVSFRLAPSQP
jgi:hypothetical protein